MNLVTLFSTPAALGWACHVQTAYAVQTMVKFVLQSVTAAVGIVIAEFVLHARTRRALLAIQ